MLNEGVLLFDATFPVGLFASQYDEYETYDESEKGVLCLIKVSVKRNRKEMV